MNIITILILFTFLVISGKMAKDLIHPAVITSALWSTLLLIYNTLDHGLYQLSDKFYCAILLWVIPFCIVTLFLGKVKMSLPVCIGIPNKKVIDFLYPLMIASLIIAIYGLYLKGYYYNSDNIFNGIRAAGVASLNGEEEEFHYPFYISLASGLASYALVVLLALFSYKKKTLTFIFFVVLIIVFFLFRSNKTVMAQLMFAFLVIGLLTKKISYKKVILFLAVGVILMLASHLLRSKDSSEFDFIRFIAIYLLAPLPGFDAMLNTHYDFINSFHGEYTFRFFVPYLQLFGINVEGNPDPFNLYNWTNTPLPMNVYTAMFSYYIDFGFGGIFIFSVLTGAFWGVLYKYAKLQYPIFQNLYAILFYILAFQFFSDYLFQFLGANVATILFAIWIYSHVTFLHIHKRLDYGFNNYRKL